MRDEKRKKDEKMYPRIKTSINCIVDRRYGQSISNNMHYTDQNKKVSY